MKNILQLLFALILSSAAMLPGAESPPAEAFARAEQLNQAVRDAFNRTPFDAAASLDAAWKFYQEFPDDYRARGSVLNLAYFTHGPFLSRNLTDAEQSSYQAVLWRRLADALPVETNDERWERLMAIEITRDLGVHQGRLQRADAPMDLAKLRRNIDALAARRPQSKALRRAEIDYVEILAGSRPNEVEPLLKKLTSSPNAGVADMAVGKLNVSAAYRSPMAIKFVGIDGREVDLAKLRGKVVLVDFWATWCGPCVAELPNVKRVYAAYHDKGFEVIGISLDSAKDRQKLVDFVAKENLPWPQHFDGKYWKNEFAVRYAISSIPAMFLLDQRGVLVSTDARGEKLEAEVKRLLML